MQILLEMDLRWATTQYHQPRVMILCGLRNRSARTDIVIQRCPYSLRVHLLHASRKGFIQESRTSRIADRFLFLFLLVVIGPYFACLLN